MRALTIALTLLATPALADVAGVASVIQAAMWADAMLDKGDLDGYGVWRRVLRAVEELQGSEPRAQVH